MELQIWYLYYFLLYNDLLCPAVGIFQNVDAFLGSIEKLAVDRVAGNDLMAGVVLYTGYACCSVIDKVDGDFGICGHGILTLDR